MSKLTDKEKVLEYLLDQKRDGQGIVYLGTNSYSAIPGIAPEHFIEQLRVLEYDELIRCAYNGPVTPKSVCFVTVKPSAFTYFEDKKTKKRKAIWNPIKITVRDIVLLAIGAAFSIASSVVSAVIVYNLLQK